MLYVYKMPSSYWEFVRETEEEVPIFLFAGTEDELLEFVVEPSDYPEGGWLCTPKGHPIDTNGFP